MTSFDKIFEDISLEISSSYGIECDIYKISFPQAIYCAVLKFATSDQLTRQWMQVNTSLSISISEKFENDFQKWNFYLIYFCDFELDKNIKYKIENNKSYSRKVTITTNDINGRTIYEIFEEDIIFTDIGFKVKSIKKFETSENDHDSELLNMIPTTSVNNEKLSDLYKAIGDKLEKLDEA